MLFEYHSGDSEAKGPDVPDLFAFAQLSGDACEGFVDQVFGRQASAVSKIRDQPLTELLISDPRLLAIRIKHQEQAVEAV